MASRTAFTSARSITSSRATTSPPRNCRIPPPNEIDRAVARQIAAEVEDGACLQIGIGGMPNAVCTLLLESGVRDLGVHTEMLTDGIAELYKAGRITGSRKTLRPGQDRLHLCARLEGHCMRRPPAIRTPSAARWTTRTLPHIIMRNDRVISINNTTQIDLQGQAASESDGHRHISGTGGQLQFVRGAYASKGGKSFICLSSTYDKRGERRSRIVLNLTPGNIVTTPRIRRDVRRHRIRHGQPEGQIGGRARASADLHRASGFS